MIAVVIPTIRQDRFEKFMEAWKDLFTKHNCQLVVVKDGLNPIVNEKSVEEVMGAYSPCITNLNSGIRNLGFAYVTKYLKDCDTIITLDDDVSPIGDPIQGHLDALQKDVPVSWMSTASEFTRGFPYSLRKESEVVLSHGVSEGSGNLDALTQLVVGDKKDITFYKGVIPRGVYYPMSGRNLAFKRKLLPYIFFAPWTNEVKGFDDTFAGIISKRIIDAMGWAVVSGYSAVLHEEASDPIESLKNEAAGIGLNENFWKGDENDPYFETYRQKHQTWQEFIREVESNESAEAPQGQPIQTEKQPESPVAVNQNIIPDEGTSSVDYIASSVEPIESSDSKEAVMEVPKPLSHEENQEKLKMTQQSYTAVPAEPIIEIQKNVIVQTTEVSNETDSGFKEEINFWRRWIEGNGKAYERSGRLSDRFSFMLQDRRRVRIANLGAGAMCLVGNWRRDVKVDVVSSDLLADEYNQILSEFHIKPAHPVEKQDMENLTYEDKSFDIVYCGNALDHTQDPRKALLEMVRICKPGGYIYLRHIAHEGKRHNYRNLHKWNIDIMENGDCRFWSNFPEYKDQEFKLSDIYPGFKTKVEFIPKGALVTSYVQLKK